MDVVDRPRDDGTTSLVLLVAVPNAGLDLRPADDGTFRGRIEAVAEFVSPDGERRRQRAIIPLRADDVNAARSRLQEQVFSLRLDGVRAAVGHLSCRLRLLPPPGGVPPDEPPETVIDAEWHRRERSLAQPGLWLHDPLFLAGAPRVDGPGGVRVTPRPRPRELQQHLHPARRYGLGAERLQVTFDAEAVGVDSARAHLLPRRLLVQVLGVGLDLSLRDTIEVVGDPAGLVAAGGVAAVTWELDVNQLPAGTYRLGCAPLDGPGSGWLTEFDVIWSLSELTAPRVQGDAVARVVLPDAEREEYFDSGPARRRAILAEFWRRHDPDPSTRLNEAELEFRRRMVYVARYLGGFGRFGPVDDRGLIYLLLGPPDAVQSDEIPLSGENLDNAIGRVYDAFLPVRTGVAVRGQEDLDAVSIQAERARRQRLGTPRQLQAFEMWTYDGRGHPLFPNPYLGDASGVRFLFLERGGSYHLELSNAHQLGSPDGAH